MNINEKTANNYALEGKLSSSVYQVNGVLGNFAEFSRVFQCAPGSKMNPTNKCSVW